MRKLMLLLLLVVITNCSFDSIIQIRVDMPYCPFSDSTIAHVDSIPVACLADSTLRKPRP